MFDTGKLRAEFGEQDELMAIYSAYSPLAPQSGLQHGGGAHTEWGLRTI